MFGNTISLRPLIVMVAVAAVACNTTVSGPAFASDETPPTVNAAVPAGSDSTSAPTPRAYVPTMVSKWPLSTVFGIETANLSNSADAIANTGATWVRRNGLIWKDVEPTEGARNWSAAADVEADMIQAANRNLKFILIIHGTPNWAAQFNNFMCSPIRPDKIGAFAAFVRDAVARYSKPPYSVKYWEIWNEPDLGRPLSGSPTPVVQPYGCWGNQNDQYYGGGEYANILKAVTPQIKAVDPSAQVVLGGLLMDCNPNQPPSGDDCRRGRYLEGILRGGGAPYFDAISFHAYDFYDNANVLGKYYNPKWFSASNTTGPVLIAKARFITDLFGQFGVTDKLLMNTEVGVLCYKCSAPLSNFNSTKAYYIPQAYAAAIAEGLAANIWYSFEGWFFSELNEPAYTAFKVARNKLGGADYKGEVTGADVGASGVKGYKFDVNGRSVWVIWSLDGSNKNITLPSAPSAITDALGAAVSSASTLQLTVKPLYIEW